MKEILITSRKSFMEIGSIYFFTATINKWQYLLKSDSYKNIIIESISYLSSKGLIDVFAFVIMPNHVHLIWRMNKMNGKETPYGSFLKFTAHAFKKSLIASNPLILEKFKVNASNKRLEFWQTDSLAIPLYNRNVALQKLIYIHNNPLSKHWELAATPTDYYYSSAKFYELNKKHFDFLKNIMEEFD